MAKDAESQPVFNERMNGSVSVAQTYALRTTHTAQRAGTFRQPADPASAWLQLWDALALGAHRLTVTVRPGSTAY